MLNSIQNIDRKRIFTILISLLLSFYFSSSLIEKWQEQSKVKIGLWNREVFQNNSFSGQLLSDIRDHPSAKNISRLLKHSIQKEVNVHSLSLQLRVRYDDEIRQFYFYPTDVSSVANIRGVNKLAKSFIEGANNLVKQEIQASQLADQQTEEELQIQMDRLTEQIDYLKSHEARKGYRKRRAVESEIRKLKEQKEEKTEAYTEKYPEIVGIDLAIARYEEQLTSLPSRTILENLKLSLDEIRLKLSKLQAGEDESMIEGTPVLSDTFYLIQSAKLVRFIQLKRVALFIGLSIILYFPILLAFHLLGVFGGYLDENWS